MDDNVISMNRRLRNLKLYRDMTEEEFAEAMLKRQQKAPKIPKVKTVSKKPDKTEYDKKYDKKVKTLMDEYSIDMNDSNDRENLYLLARLSLQLEQVDEQIREIGQDMNESNLRDLKAIGDYQRSLVMSIGDIQNSLGISRKFRREKQVDDIPQFIDGLLSKAKTYFDRVTVPIECSRCEIELARYWLNFPKLAHAVEMQLECWKCHEKVVYAG